MNEYWTVAGVLGHIAYWDIRFMVLADKIDRGERGAGDAEPDGDWLNDSTCSPIHAIALERPRALALRMAEETDAQLAAAPGPALAGGSRKPDQPGPRRASRRAPGRDRGRTAHRPDSDLQACSTSRRPWIERIRVTSSAYSRSPPTGSPRAMRVTTNVPRQQVGQVQRRPRLAQGSGWWPGSLRHLLRRPLDQLAP